MSLLLDYRAGSKQLANFEPIRSLLFACRLCKGYKFNANCSSCYGTGRELSSLSSADVCFTGNGPNNHPIIIGIELKTVSEVIDCRRTGRLAAGQIPKMLEDYDEKWLCYYGAYRCNEKGYIEFPKKKSGKTVWEVQYHYGAKGRYTNGKLGRLGNNQHQPIYHSYLESFLITLQDAGIRVKFIPGIYDQGLSQAAIWIGELYQKRQKELLDQNKAFRSFDESREILPGLTGNKKIIAEMVSSIGGIGFERAEAVANYFADDNISIRDNLKKLVNATHDEWANIEIRTKRGKGRVVRLGPVIADRFFGK